MFDCFGVLITDSLQLLRQDLASRDEIAAKEVKDLIGLTNRGILSPNETRPKVAALFGLSADEYIQTVMSGEVKNSALLNYITELRATYKIGMLSNIGSGSLHKRFTQEELDAHFDAVVASGDVGYAKPDKRAYEIVAERLGVAPEE